MLLVVLPMVFLGLMFAEGENWIKSWIIVA